jgi:hypothetical protein
MKNKAERRRPRVLIEAARCSPAFRAAQKRINFESLGPTSSKERPPIQTHSTATRIRLRTAVITLSLTVEALLGKVIAIGE